MRIFIHLKHKNKQQTKTAMVFCWTGHLAYYLSSTLLLSLNAEENFKNLSFNKKEHGGQYDSLPFDTS